MTEGVKIDAAGLFSAQLSADGSRLNLKLLDNAGQAISVSLPISCLNAMITAIPQTVKSGAVYPLDTWSVSTAENGQDLLLTLRTAEGLTVSFTTKPWQVEGMATVAIHGFSNRASSKILN